MQHNARQECRRCRSLHRQGLRVTSLQVTEQLHDQQLSAADRAAGLEAEVAQLQQQLTKAQTDAEETHAAAKLRQIEHENHTQALAKVTLLLLVLLALLCSHTTSLSLCSKISEMVRVLGAFGSAQQHRLNMKAKCTLCLVPISFLLLSLCVSARLCVCVCVCACAHVCMRVCVCVRAYG